jgi:hypothetical protein
MYAAASLSSHSSCTHAVPLTNLGRYPDRHGILTLRQVAGMARLVTQSDVGNVRFLSAKGANADRSTFSPRNRVSLITSCGQRSDVPSQLTVVSTAWTHLSGSSDEARGTGEQGTRLRCKLQFFIPLDVYSNGLVDCWKTEKAKHSQNEMTCEIGCKRHKVCVRNSVRGCPFHNWSVWWPIHWGMCAKV